LPRRRLFFAIFYEAGPVKGSGVDKVSLLFGIRRVKRPAWPVCEAPPRDGSKMGAFLASLRGPPFHGEATAGSRKAAKHAKQGSFFCAKKKVVLGFLCVSRLFMLVQSEGGSRKAAKHAKNPKKARLGL
jgi:hypothetical protein